LLLAHEEGKNPQVGSGTKPVSKEEGQGFKKQGELLLYPVWSSIRIIFPEIGVRTVLQTGASTSLETGARIAPEHGFLENQAREESAAMDSPTT